ncbi:MAG: AmmeMemoRadiSam system protein B [Candidatus Stygibacter australis]|nr:AmmeMemoRadiSam system protein B [Candidatus Stygibacter australis]
MEHVISILLLLVFCLVLPLDCRTRKPAVSGRWYPSDPVQLKQDIRGYLAQVELTPAQQKIIPIGMMVPHAGYMFSAPVAAWSYKLLEGKEYDTVILLGSSHHYASGIVSVYDGEDMETPLGNIPVDTELAKQIISSHNNIKCDEKVHFSEHSNEAQLPFLQYLLQDFNIVSILTSTNDKILLAETADIIYQKVKESGKKVLFINSTDMSHFHPYEEANRIDSKTTDLILAENWTELERNITCRECELCGYHAFTIFQQIMQKLESGKPQLLHYANSGDTHPEYGTEEVVGYSALVFPKAQTDSIVNTPESLSAADKTWLLQLARNSIIDSLENSDSAIPIPKNPKLTEDRAVFVTLHKHGDLRGCIGHMIARDELYKAIWEMAKSAAFADPRFAPVSRRELENIIIEISILTPMKKIESLDDIVMGRDGVMVQQGYHSGVFLPQVARETGWDKVTFLQHLCHSKAMLPPDAFLDPLTDIFIFQVEEFSE